MTFRKTINAFINDELHDEELCAFLDHLKSCKKCYEELEINYIVIEGVGILDENNRDYNLLKAYANALKADHAYIAVKKRLMLLRYVMDTLCFWALLGIALLGIRLFF